MTPQQRERHDEGMTASASAAATLSRSAIEHIRQAIDALIASRRPFTTDQVWSLLPHIPPTKAIGSILGSYIRRGRVIQTGRTIICNRGGAHDHAQQLKEWQAA